MFEGAIGLGAIILSGQKANLKIVRKKEGSSVAE